ncbi:MAG TPA: glycosyltransferase family 1 protein, partial [Acidobacteriaceae bacterium]|nr:glycosyltransferase family 1 protein [Acidobacteriaceae bacterium]
MPGRDPARPDSQRIRLAYLVSHPIQYQAPLLRRIAQEPDIDLTVFFGSDFSVRGYRDEGFGVPVKWDVPLLDGYRHVFLPRLRDGNHIGIATPLNRGVLRALKGPGAQPAFDVLWVHGYASVNSIHGMLAAKLLGIPVMLRAESWLRDRGRSAGKLIGKRFFFGVLESLIDAVLPIGTVNSEYWHHYFGDRVPQFLTPYAVDNRYFSERARQAQGCRTELQKELDLE